jgi:tRNA-dihydrouridine synthase
MGDVVNLRKARKLAEKQEDARRAAANRIVHGRSKADRTLETARAQKIRRVLDAHRIDRGDSR